jgi:hypothetical protein
VGLVDHKMDVSNAWDLGKATDCRLGRDVIFSYLEGIVRLEIIIVPGGGGQVNAASLYVPP